MPMIAQHSIIYGRELFQEYERFRVDVFRERHFSPEALHEFIDKLVSGSPAVKVKDVGKSFEGRPIRLITAGGGPARVLLWCPP